MRLPSPAFVVATLFVVLFGSVPLPAVAERDVILAHAHEPWRGDLDGMARRGFLRILTVHNPLLFTFDGARETGMVAELARLYEEHLADEIGRVRSPTVVVIPVARNELLPGLIEGRGDLVMGNLTITPERLKLVDFGPPIYPDVDELVITGPAVENKIRSLDDLVDIGLHLRRSSSYFEHMQAVNARREARGKAPIPITEADENLEDYDLLDMVNAGILGAIVVDSHKAVFWERVFDRIEVHYEIPVHSGNSIAWAIRKNSPRLMQSIEAFSEKVRKGSLLGNIVRGRYLEDAEWLDNVLDGKDLKRYRKTIEVIKRYAAKYDFEWQIIAAQAYQESQFDQRKRSPAGAIGVMQLLPSTAASQEVGIPDITQLENNVHAGVKYLHWLRETYYSDSKIAPLDQVLFSLAAYNAGPGNMARARRRAKRLGFDPNRWFGNVEIGMYRSVSGEPASYVRNIYKYYVTYLGLERSREAREVALEEHNLGRGKGSTPFIVGGLILVILCALGFWARKRLSR